MEADEQMESLSQYVFGPILDRFNVPKKEQPYWISFTFHGCMAIVAEWLRRNCEESEEEVERIIIDCIHPDLIQKSEKKGNTCASD